MRGSMRLAILVALACSAFAAFAIVAAARTMRYDSTVTISFHRGHHHQGESFSGKVISVKHRCSRHRDVVVRRRLDGPNPLIGTDFTNRHGDWEVQVTSAPAGTYYAKARKKVLRRGAHRRVCRAAFSQDLPVHGKPGP